MSKRQSKESKRGRNQFPSSDFDDNATFTSDDRRMLQIMVDKLGKLDILDEIKTDVSELKRSVEYSHAQIEMKMDQTVLRREVTSLKLETTRLTTENEKLKADLLELRCRSMRDELLIVGISEVEGETRSIAENLVRVFLQEQLDIPEEEVREIQVERAHRIGKRKEQGKSRPMVVKFTNSKWKDKVLALSRELEEVKAPPSTKEALSLIRQSEKRPDNLKSSMDEYKRKMEAKARSAASSSLDVQRTVQMPQNAYQTSEKMHTGRPFVNDIAAQKEANHLKKTDATKKSAETKKSSGKSCRGFGWYLWHLVFVVLLSSVALLVYRFLPVLQSKIAGGRGQGSREVMPGEFSHRLSLLQSQFPSQRAELWKRTKIHLEKHLGTADPTEPVSLILAAGRKAEGTLRSLAQDLASTYSFALNGSVLFIDGASKAGQGGDEVKLDIDNQLRAAFEGDKPAAIIHRFEELPPGSTLIFYRYCDHETAAYKQVFILLTVLLPQDEISSDLSLKDVEETVLNYVQTKLVGSTSDASFNEMDNNKFGGLWSRISHVVLPVVSEEVKQD